MTRLLRLRALFAAATLVAATLFVAVSAQAACDGGTCPITSGSLRTQVGTAFLQPFVCDSGVLCRGGVPTTIPYTIPLTPPSGKMSYFNSARGAIVATPSAMVTVPSNQTGLPNNDYGNPAYSFDIPASQLTWGQGSPPLVKVPLFPVPGAGPTLLGLTTQESQAWPGPVATLPEARMQTPQGGTATSLGGTVMVGSVNFAAGGRSGAATVTYCVGAPGPVTPAWTGSCVGFTPLTTGGLTGAQEVPASVRFIATANQFGGPAYQRQRMTPNWLGKINFNDFVDPITQADLSQTSVKKQFPTLPQNLVETVAWGAPFRALVARTPMAPGDKVSGFLTISGAALVGPTTQTVTPLGTGMGLAQTSTTWGAPWTTGQIQVKWVAGGLPFTFTHTGNDQRGPGGNGSLSLVTGSMADRSISGPGANRQFVTLNLPEPSLGLGLFAGLGALAALARRRKAA